MVRSRRASDGQMSQSARFSAEIRCRRFAKKMAKGEMEGQENRGALRRVVQLDRVLSAHQKGV